MDPGPTSQLKVLHWNVRGVRGKITAIRHLLREYEVDVALLSETLLAPKDLFRVPGYIVYRQDYTDGSRACRGVAVVVGRRLLHQALPPPPVSSLFATGVEVLLGTSRTHLYAAYKPPGSRLDISDIHRLLSEEPTVIAGDLNCKHPGWGSRISNPDGSRLFADAEASGYSVVGTYVPTHYPDTSTHSPDVLDVAIVHRLPGDFDQDVLDEAHGSDHLPVLATIRATPASVPPRPPHPVRNWDVFSLHLHENTPNFPVDSAASVERMTRQITDAISAALDAATKPSTRRQHKRPPLPRAVVDLIQEKKRLRRLWQRTRCPTLKNLLNRTTAQVRKQLEDINAAQWTQRILEAGEDWPSLHRFCRTLTRTTAPIKPLLHPDGNVRYRAEDRAEIHAEHLERQFSPWPTAAVDHVQTVSDEVRNFLFLPPSGPPSFSISPREVKKVLSRLKPKKAPGADGIPNAALRRLPFRTVAALTRLFNGIVRFGHFPTPWKTGLIITIPKPRKDPRKAESYRPITLLSTLSKTFESLFLRHLTPFLPPRREQFGFRAELSTTNQLARVIHHLSAAANKKTHSVAVFLDMEKAFDSVWHEGLLYKMLQADVPHCLVRVLASFLTGRCFRVRVDGAVSSERPISAGVPQGSVISPDLYNFYASDVPTDPGTQAALYADDTAFFASSMSLQHAARKVQKTLDLLPSWLSKWRLSVNAGKSQALPITTRSSLPPPLKIGEDLIPWSRTAKYLGVIIDSRLSMAHQSKSAVNSARVAVALLLRPAYSSPQILLSVRLALYKTYVRSRLTYAAPAWHHLLSATQKKALQTVQNRVLRRITRAPWYVRNDTISRDLRVESVEAFVARLSTTMFARADASRLPELADLAPWHARPPDRHRLPRDAVLAEDPAEPLRPPAGPP